MKPPLLERYQALVELPAHTRQVSLGEGDTPLIPMPRMAEHLGGGFELYVKYEGLNPTGSFKDRGMTAAVGEAAGRGMRAVICASTGNTAASAAAYAARAGLAAYVLIPQGQVAAGKLAGARAYGARVLQIEGSFDDALALVLEICQRQPLALVNSLNPFRLQGQKTAAFEIVEQLGAAPDWLCLPVGNAGNITACWQGFQQYHQLHQSGVPALLGVQAAGAAPLVHGTVIAQPETVATAIRIGNPARGPQALAAAKESGGRIVAAADEHILAMQRRLAAEGVWVEPASAAGLAGLAAEVAARRLDLRGRRVVAVCTGHGLKDAESISRATPEPQRIPAALGALEEALGNLA